VSSYYDLVSADYQRTCARTDCRHCRCAIDLRDGRWLDRSGNHWCPNGLLVHEPVAVQQHPITPSPLLRPIYREEA
jgi:hypothetical protein